MGMVSPGVNPRNRAQRSYQLYAGIPKVPDAPSWTSCRSVLQIASGMPMNVSTILGSNWLPL